jgi:hypothetical protein
MRERRFRFHALVAVMMSGAAATGMATSASATTTISGTGTIAGTITMAYPCSGCGGGTMAASAVMSLGGVPESGDAYDAVWPDPRTTPAGTVPTNFSSNSVGFTNQCLVTEPVPPLTGPGGAGFTLSGGMLVVNGVVWDNATLTGNLTWQWIGPTTAQATLTGLTLTGGSGPSVIAVSLNLNNDVVGVGAMTFAWTLPMGNCAVQNPNQTVMVTATLFQPA